MAKRRRVRLLRKPPLRITTILRWADAHHKRTGKWPTAESAGVIGAPGETWKGITQDLRLGFRGLPGDSSLPRLLEKWRGYRNIHNLPRLTVKKILKWADVHHKHTGEWPKHISGPILGAPGERWKNIENALMHGQRGLPGGSSLAKLLADYRGVRNMGNLPRLTKKQIFAWAQAHYRRTGEWPSRQSGVIPGTWGETWSGVNAALSRGHRGLPGGTSLARFLAARRRLRR